MGNKGSKAKGGAKVADSSASKAADAPPSTKKKEEDVKPADDAKAPDAEVAPAEEVKEDGDSKESDFTNRMTVYVVQARNLPKYDNGPNAKSDPYVKVQFEGLPQASYRTTYIRKELNPVWNASFAEEGVRLFGAVERISFAVYDRDQVTRDDLMGSCSVATLKQPGFYTSPLQWVPLLDDDGKVVVGQNGKESALQISIRYAPKVEELSVRKYTHVLELTLKQGKDIKSADFVGKSDPYVQLEFGSQRYQSKPLHDTKNPVWNEKAFFFVHSELNAKTQMKLTVMDQDLGKDDKLGTGYVSAPELIEAAGDGAGTKVVRLREVDVGSDKALLDMDKEEKTWGDLELGVQLVPKAEVEKGFFQALVKEFDRNDDGVIDAQELQEMFAQLQIDENTDELLRKFDDDNDMKLDEAEVLRMLQDADFQGSDLATQLIALHLRGDMAGDHRAHLMAGFSSKRNPNGKTLKIKDRGTGLIVQEHIPKYVDWALRLVYNVGVSRKVVQGKLAHSVLAKASRSKGAAMDLAKSASDIPGFVRQHNLDTSTLYKKVGDFATFNDFFARGMKVDECRPLASPEDEGVVVSPADSRMMVWDTILDATKVWIKGKRFTLENLLGPESAVDLKQYEGGSFAIARLAPQDYHRWHYPVGGKVTAIERIDGALYTVNPIAINKPVDVYTENKRAVIEIDGGDRGRCVMFAIAATMVGSYTLFRTEAEDPTQDGPVPLQLGDEVKRGDVAGEFRFGGSTVLMLFEPNKVKWSEDIQRNVAADIETLVTVRSAIGKIE